MLLQAGLRSTDEELAPEMHRTISGDLLNEEEMDRVMEEAGEEPIYHVRTRPAAGQHRLGPFGNVVLALVTGSL